MFLRMTKARPLAAAHLIVTCIFCSAIGHAEASGAADDPNSDHAHEHEHETHDVIEEIVVTSSPFAHDRDELATPVDRVERNQILRNLGSTLGETIEHIPGVTTSGFAAGASRPVIRGQDSFRTGVLEDGIGTHDVSQESPDHAIPINPLAATRIEIVRGPATLRYGGGAMAGVVNTITNRVPDRIPSESISGEVFAGIGLLANERDIAAMLDGGTGLLAWHADAVLRRAHNYSIPNDDNPHTQTGSQHDSFSGALGASVLDEYGRIGFSYARIESDYGIPETDESVEIEMKTDRFRFEGDLEAPISGVREIRMRGVYSDYQHDEIANGVNGQTFRNKEFEGRLELLHEELGGFIGAVGMHGRYRELRAEGEAAEFLAPTDSSGVALYVVEERELSDEITAEIGFRVEHVRVEGRDANNLRHDLDFNPLSGSASLTIRTTDWLTVGILGAVSQRAPSPSELFARGPHEATGTFERGDTDLDPETAYTAEFRVEAKGLVGRIEIAGFATLYEDYIFGEMTGNRVGEDGLAPGEFTELVFTGRDAFFYGAEVSGEVDLFDTKAGLIGIDGRFDFVRARFRNGSDRNLPRIVPIRWGAGVFFEGEQVDARIGFLRTESQQDISQFESTTASFTTLNATLTYHLSLMEDRVPIEVSIGARNLTDIRGRNHVSFNKDEVLLPGRSIRFSMRAMF